MTTPFPEPDSIEIERYSVSSPVEVNALLRRLCEERVLVTVYCDGIDAFAVTNVLTVQAKLGSFLFDFASDEHANRRIGAARRLVLVGFVDQVKLQFATERAVAVMHEGQPAWAAPLPIKLLRLQRRDTFRMRTPRARPASVRVPQPQPDHPDQTLELRVADISIGGLRLALDPARGTLPDDRVIEDCELDLPGVGGLRLSLRVRHVEAPRSERGERLFGCEFIRISAASEMQVQRYIHLLQVESRKLAG
ncbi:MAG: flagellar brake protein [Burkholderiaceae bacterium]